VNVLLIDEQDDPLEPSALIALASSTMAAEGLPDDTEVAVHLVDVERITELNEQHLGKTGPTDVLSFPIEDLEPGAAPAGGDDGPPVNIGDVMICPDVVRSNAASAGVSFDDELALMVVHGVLHLLGYDHVVDADAEIMEARERTLLAAAGRTRP
jgi:probable rRNA maturation factor